jgi:hypothetical protein
VADIGKVLLDGVPAGTWISSDYVEVPDGYDAVVVELNVQGTSPGASLTTLDSATPQAGYKAVTDSNGAQAGLTGSTTNKYLVVNVLRYVKVQLVVTGGVWQVRVTPIRATNQATVNVQATISGHVIADQGVAAGVGGAWPVKLTDGTGTVGVDGAAARASLYGFGAAAGDTPLRTTAALGDASSAGLLGAGSFGFNGATWDQLRSGNVSNAAAATGFADALVVGRYDAAPTALTSGRFSALQLGTVGGAVVQPYSAATGQGDGAVNNPWMPVGWNGATLYTGVYNYGFNGASWDRIRTGAQANAAAATGILAALGVGQYNASAPSVTSAQFNHLQIDQAANLRVTTDAAQVKTVDLSFTSPSSATTTAFTPATGLGGYRSMAVYAALQGGTGGTLDVYVQISPDGGTTWVDYAHFAQLAAGAAQVFRLFTVSKAGQQTAIATVGTGTSPALAASTVVGGDWGDRLRVVAVAGAGTTAGAAQTIKCVLTP